MVAEEVAGKRRMTTENEGKTDRLSSFPDEILINIISRLRFRSAVITGSLSRRWRGLWKNMTSVCINSHTSDSISSFVSQFRSPVIDSFVIEVEDEECRGKLINFESWPISIDLLLRLICDRNVRELRLTRNNITGWSRTYPKFIFQTRSLVSLELGLTLDFDVVGPNPRIVLPNLMTLKLIHTPSLYGWLETLIQACPSLEELSLTCEWPRPGLLSQYEFRGQNFRFSNQNLRRLFIDSYYNIDSKIVINAPKLECLDIGSLNSASYCFEEEPVGLIEARIIVDDFYSYTRPMKDGISLMSTKFYGTIFNARFLTLDFKIVLLVCNMSIVFRNATRVTIEKQASHQISTVLSLLDRCPALDVLTLKFFSISDGQLVVEKRDILRTTTSPRALTRIEIETDWYSYDEPTEAFIKLVKYLLSGAINLKQFHFKVWGYEDDDIESVDYKRSRESELYKLLYTCPMAALTGCEIEFTGRYFKTSRKIG